MGNKQSDGDDGAYQYADGFDGYVEMMVDPGIWLILAMTCFCISSMLILMPVLVCRQLNKQSKQQAVSDYTQFQEDSMKDDDAEVLACNVL